MSNSFLSNLIGNLAVTSKQVILDQVEKGKKLAIDITDSVTKTKREGEEQDDKREEGHAKEEEGQGEEQGEDTDAESYRRRRRKKRESLLETAISWFRTRGPDDPAANNLVESIGTLTIEEERRLRHVVLHSSLLDATDDNLYDDVYVSREEVVLECRARAGPPGGEWVVVDENQRRV